jgi:hypothetical protein
VDFTALYPRRLKSSDIYLNCIPLFDLIIKIISKFDVRILSQMWLVSLSSIRVCYHVIRNFVNYEIRKLQMYYIYSEIVSERIVMSGHCDFKFRLRSHIRDPAGFEVCAFPHLPATSLISDKTL